MGWTLVFDFTIGKEEECGVHVLKESGQLNTSVGKPCLGFVSNWVRSCGPQLLFPFTTAHVLCTLSLGELHLDDIMNYTLNFGLLESGIMPNFGTHLQNYPV